MTSKLNMFSCMSIIKDETRLVQQNGPTFQLFYTRSWKMKVSEEVRVRKDNKECKLMQNDM